MLPLWSMLTLTNPLTIIIGADIVTPGSTKVQKAMAVAFDYERIVWIKKSTEPVLGGANDKRIDGRGKTLIPGLWDMHTHLADGNSLGLFIANGVTGIRVMFGAAHQLQWRKDVQNGKILGPQMILASPIVDGPKPIWPGSITVSTAEQGREAVRKIKKDGYDFVKVYSLLSKDAYYGIADECKKLGIPFAGHVPHSIGILEAQKAGQISAEHLMGNVVEASTHADEIRKKLDVAGQEGLAKASAVSLESAKEIIESFSPEKEAALIKGLKGGTLWQCPTLVVLRNVANLNNEKLFSDNVGLKYTNPFVRNGWDPKNDFRFKSRTEADWERSRKNYQSSMSFFGRLIKGGANILAGTDCLNPYVYPGFSLHEECQLLVQAGMTPTNALAAATVNPARFLHLEKTQGTVAVGKVANMVLLDANPLDDIRNTSKIHMVINQGKVYDRAEIDKILSDREFK